jgi:hypothetical protein
MFKFYCLHAQHMILSVHLVIERNGKYISPITRFENISGSSNQSSDHIPYSEWIQLPEEQRNKILAK